MIGSRTAAFFAGKTIWVAGHRGLAGSALVRRLQQENCVLLLPSRAELDLTRQADVESWFEAHRPDIVFVAAGKVGGIGANSRAQADFLYENLLINTNIMGAAHTTGVERLVALGSSCIYPRDTVQPITESALMSGPLERTNEGYAVAKIAAIKMAEFFAEQYDDSFVSVMPTNLYGPNDNFHPGSSHVLAALVRRFAEAVERGAAEVTVWGTGAPRREFLHADDLAEACLCVAEHCSRGELLNVGSGEEVSIRELAELIAEVVGFRGSIAFDMTKPDGTPRKRLDTSVISSLGWRPRIQLRDGIAEMQRHWQSVAQTQAA